VKLILSIASREFRNNIGGATRAIDNLRSKARRLAYVASTTTASGELVGSGFAYGTFARDSSVSVDCIIMANVAGA